MNKVYYGNMINLTGLYSKTPIKCCYINSFLDNVLYDLDGCFSINPNKLGTEIRDGYIKFTSENELEVEKWTQGALAALKMLNRWSKT